MIAAGSGLSAHAEAATGVPASFLSVLRELPSPAGTGSLASSVGLELLEVREDASSHNYDTKYDAKCKIRNRPVDAIDNKAQKSSCP